jgi:hypothetical protein
VGLNTSGRLSTIVNLSEFPLGLFEIHRTIRRPYQDMMASINSMTQKVAQPSPSYFPSSTMESVSSPSSLLSAPFRQAFQTYASSLPSRSSINVTSSTVEYKTTDDPNDPSNPFHIVHLTQAKVDAGVLSVIGNALALSSGATSIAASSLSVIKDTLGFLPVEWGLIEKPLQLDVSLTSFGITLFNDGLKYNTGADILGKEAKFIAMWEALKAQVLNPGSSIGPSYDNVIAQLTEAKAILEPLTTFYSKQ